MRLRLEAALRGTDDLLGDGVVGVGGLGGLGDIGGLGIADLRSASGAYDTSAPLNDAAGRQPRRYEPSGRRRRRARSHGSDDDDLGSAAGGGGSSGGGSGLYSSSAYREENRRRASAYSSQSQTQTSTSTLTRTAHALPAVVGRSRSGSRYSTGTFSSDGDTDNDDGLLDSRIGAAVHAGGANSANSANGSSRSFDSESSRSSVGLGRIAHSLDMEERYGLSAVGERSRMLTNAALAAANRHVVPSAGDILNGNGGTSGGTNGGTSGGGDGGDGGDGGGGYGGGGGFGFDDDDRWAAREQKWLHQQRDRREEEMRGVGVHRDVDLHDDEHERQEDREERKRLDDLRRRSMSSMASGGDGSGGSGSWKNPERVPRRSSMGRTVSAEDIPRAFAGSLASMGISISRNIAPEMEPTIPPPPPQHRRQQSADASSGIAETSPGASESSASLLPTSSQFTEQTNQLFSRLGSLGRTVGDSVGDAVSTALKNRQEQLKAKNHSSAGGGRPRSGSKSGGGGGSTGGQQQRRRRRRRRSSTARNAKNSSRFFTPSVDGRGVLPQTITETDEEGDDTLFSKLAIRGFNLARLVDETVPNAERFAAESSGGEFDYDEEDDEVEEAKSQSSARDYGRDGSGFDHPDQPPIPPVAEEKGGRPNYGNQSLAASMFPADSYAEDDDRSGHWSVDGQNDATISFASRRSSVGSQSLQQQQHRRSRLSDHVDADAHSDGSADEAGADEKEDDAKSVQSHSSSVRSSSSALSSKVSEWKREHRASTSGARSVDDASSSVRRYNRSRRPRSGSSASASASASNPPGEVKVAIPIMSQRQRGAAGGVGAGGGANALAIATKNLSKLAEAQQQKKRNAGGGDSSAASIGTLDSMKKPSSSDSLGSRGGASSSLKLGGGGNSTWNFAA